MLYAVVRWRGARRPDARQWGAAALVGFATFVASHGLLAWASQFVTSDTAALAYLIIAGSLVAYSAYVWLCAPTASRVSAHALVNPIVAVLLGASRGSRSRARLAATLVVAGVVLVALAPRLARRQVAPSEAPCAGC